MGAAKKESDQIREQTQRAVDGRVAAAEKAAAEVLEEARALSGGLRQLGRSLEEQADRILRDVTAAHKRMQADLRIGPGRRAPSRPSPRPPASPTARRGPPANRRQPSRQAVARRRPRRRRRRASARTRSRSSRCPNWVGARRRLTR